MKLLACLWLCLANRIFFCQLSTQKSEMKRAIIKLLLTKSIFHIIKKKRNFLNKIIKKSFKCQIKNLTLTAKSRLVTQNTEARKQRLLFNITCC